MCSAMITFNPANFKELFYYNDNTKDVCVYLYKISNTKEECHKFCRCF